MKLSVLIGALAAVIGWSAAAYAFNGIETLKQELTDLKHSYREAIDGKLAAEREVEGMKAKQERLEKFFKELGQ